MFGSFSKLPAGNIAPARFVKLGAVAGTCLQCGAGEDIYGISTPHTRKLALSGIDDGFAGVDGDGALNIIGPGDDEALLELGGTVTYGQRLKSDADGKGVAATTDKDKTGAIAQSAGTSGMLIKVKPMRYDVAV
jgi:hypothetical protein